MSNVKVHVIGRLGADAEIKESKKGTKFVTFNLAVDDYWQGERKTTWFSVADTSENAKKRIDMLKKGVLIEVQGIETCRLYMDRSSNPQIARDIMSTRIDFIFTGKSNNEATSATAKTTENQTTTQSSANTAQAATAAASTASNTDVEDDLPF